HGGFWGALVGLAAMVVLAVLLLWFSLDSLSAVAARQVPADWERGLGKSVMQQFRASSDFLDDKEAERLLAPLTSPLVQAVPGDRHRFRFHIVKNPAINAFALPGGEIAIHSELILRAQSAPELQGVLAHEIAHVTEQHGLRAVIRSTGLFIVAQALIGDASGVMAALANAGPLLINQSYSRRFEHEADEKGLELLLAAKVDPKGLTDFFRTIQAEEKRQKDRLKKELPEEAGKNAEALEGALEGALGYLRSHPETPERIAALEKRIADAGGRDWRDDELAFRALQASVRQFVSKNENPAE
ncbi:MAG: M48 family metallopeptidase, partial [Moraxellaceae bacterium]|nr:M48 family metallopeptidase [Moraxellaceae bacterium]